DDLHVEVWLCDVHADLVVRVLREDREGAGEDREAHRRQTGGAREHVLLGDAELEPAVRKLVLEATRRGRCAEVGVDHDDVEAFVLEANQRGAKGLTSRGGCGSRDGHASAPSSCIAAANCSAFGAAPWKPGLFSMKETPLPLVVSKIT